MTLTGGLAFLALSLWAARDAMRRPDSALYRVAEMCVALAAACLAVPMLTSSAPRAGGRIDPVFLYACLTLNTVGLVVGVAGLVRSRVTRRGGKQHTA